MPTSVVGRHRARFVPFALLVVVLGVLLFPATAGAAGTLDQQWTVPDNAGAGIIGEPRYVYAQVFTAGVTGILDHVELKLFLVYGTAPLTIQIQSVTSSGSPSGTILATATIDHSAFGSNSPGTWVAVPFATPAPSVKGTQYAIVLSTVGQTNYGWLGTPDPRISAPYTGQRGPLYTGGAAQSTSVYYSYWLVQPSFSFNFKTYVTPLPTSKAQCLHGGWKTFGTMFKNQGQCIQYVKGHGGQGGDGGGDD